MSGEISEKVPAMHSGDWPEFANGFNMDLGAITHVLVEAVMRVLLVQFLHLPVPTHLRENGCGGDGNAARVGLWSAQPGKWKRLVRNASIEDHTVEVRKFLERFFEQSQIQLVQVA
jgi:hypothetical protein